MARALNPDMVLLRSKVSRLDQVKNLNMWGNDLDSVEALEMMPNLEVLSLSVNNIRTLENFQFCKKLKELYLRKNLIDKLEEVSYLQNLPELKVLWLWENPCCENTYYRDYIIAMLPWLEKLDNQAISDEERNQAVSRIKAGQKPQVRREIDQKIMEPPREVQREVHREPQREQIREPHLEANNDQLLIQAQKRELENQKLEMELRQREIENQRRELETRRREAEIARRDTELRMEEQRQKDEAQQMAKPPKQNKIRRANTQSSDTNHENLLCAVLALLKELDRNELELIKRDIERKLAQQLEL